MARTRSVDREKIVRIIESASQPLSTKEVASKIGAAYPTVNNILNALYDEERIEYHGKGDRNANLWGPIGNGSTPASTAQEEDEPEEEEEPSTTRRSSNGLEDEALAYLYETDQLKDFIAHIRSQ